MIICSFQMLHGLDENLAKSYVQSSELITLFFSQDQLNDDFSAGRFW